MIEAVHILTLTPIKKGRKYFKCSLPDKGYTANLIINGLTNDLVLNVPVAIRAKDLSRHSSFGSQIIYEAVRILVSQWTEVEKNGASVAIIERPGGTRLAMLSEQIMVSDNYEQPNWGSLMREAVAESDARKLDLGTVSSNTRTMRARL